MRAFFVLTLCALLPALGLVAQTRTALVMGVGDYGGATYKGKSIPNLPGIVTADLPNMAAKLESLGFTVTVVTNPTLGEAKAAVDTFSAKLKAAPGVSLFYFSGHGGESEGKNYLIPRRASIGSKADLADEALSAQRVLNGMEESGAQVNLVFLDCCREDLGKNIGGAEMQPMRARGSFIGFATRSGDFADPGEEGSPYTRFLLKHLDKPGVSVADMYGYVVKDVNDYTKQVLGEERRPGFYSELEGEPFCFVPLGLTRNAAPVMPVIPPPAPSVSDDYVQQAGTTAGERWLIGVAPGVTIPFRWCPPGRFTMGSPASEHAALKAAGKADSFYADEVEHTVTLTRGFWMAETEVTQGQWQAVMGTTLVQQANKMLEDDAEYTISGEKATLLEISGMQKGDGANMTGDESERIPMYYVNWEEAAEFCTKASRHAGQRGWAIALPTEAQWEYACRSGTRGTTYRGDFTIKGEMNGPGLDTIAWYGGNSSVGYSGTGWNTDAWKEKQYPGGTAGPRRVGGRPANEWGLHDMLGNVWEWCADYYGPYATGHATDPQGATSGANRVDRGSSWGGEAAYCRAALRVNREPGFRSNYLGFRPALVPAK
jgi:formylglycine-generating enzyme required for sulfatase activity